MSAPETNTPTLQRAASEPTEHAIDQLKQENSKLHGSTSASFPQDELPAAGRHTQDIAGAVYCQSELTGPLEKLSLDIGRHEQGFRAHYDRKPQHEHSANISVLATSKLANQAGPKVSQSLTTRESC